QGGTPEPEAPLQEAATPPPAATPPLGERPDGTYTWRVQVGAFGEADLIEAMAFLPEEITVNAGDSVFFDIHGFHTVTFPSGQEPPPLLVPESALGGAGGGATPAAGAGRIVVNPEAGFPAGGNTYDGTGYVNSGLPDPSAPPFTLTFAQPGTYEYLCLVHPAMMKARVVVQEQGAERPHDQAFYDRQAAEQQEAILEQGRALIARYSQATPAAGAAGGNTWEVTAGVGEGQAQVLRFLPERLEVRAGDTVRWVNRAHTEPHTVTFVDGGAPPEFVLVEPQAGGPPLLVLNPEVMQRAGGKAYGGEGYANSGWLQEESPELYAGFEAPHTYELAFEAPGEFAYYCALHAGGPDDPHGMTGTITVGAG
ncbi:MAG: plastocyanin/azurin family copper-binding protein, partial [Chloroflexota bacterium]|nr:plastocyanin/azurin family copper-binding protein [Chloroflexota bacterium]